MRVLSLFDGMACGMIAFKHLGIPVEQYDAYEIVKYAMAVAKHNFPEIIERGDVFNEDFKRYEGNVDWLIGGSPCTYWSIAQSPDKRETTASGIGWELFSQYVRALREAKPKYFLYENNKSMSKQIRASITETFGFEPICINSALVSAQNRQRLYWVGIRQDDGTYRKADIEQPEDRGVLLKDVLDGAVAWRDKAHTIDATYYKGGTLNGDRLHQSSSHLMGAEPVCMRYERTDEAKACRKAYEAHEIHHGYHELCELHPRTDRKSNTLSTVLKDNPICEPVCVAERGRYSADGSIEQHYEVRGDKTNTLTTVAKDNLVAEPVNCTADGKAQCIRATCYKDGVRNIIANEVDKKTGVAEPVRIGGIPSPDGTIKNSQGMRIYSIDGKSVTQSANGGGMGAKTGLYAIPVDWDNNKPTKAISCADGKEYPVYKVENGQITIKGKTYPIKLRDGFYIIRKLTVTECKRLQTVPEWYDMSVISDSQAYKCLGNGWTVEVIMYLISSAMRESA